jgi:hypothetical protein
MFAALGEDLPDFLSMLLDKGVQRSAQALLA